MSRSLRIEYENAWYHVMNRGARKMDIFNTDAERKLFLELLGQVHKRYQIEIHAYCLMNNHYHLLLKTPLANLSKAMKHLNGVYVQRYNKVNQIDGPLFRGRFKSIIVDANNYLLRLSRYIHLNPVKGNLVNRAEDYQWSSCAAYLGEVESPDWLQTQQVLSQFGNKLQQQKYKLFLEEGVDKEITSFFNKLKRLPILGCEAFTKTISEKYLHEKALSLEVPEQNLLYKKKLPKLDEVMAVVAEYYQIDLAELLKSKRGLINLPRSVAIYLACQMTGQNLQVIAKAFNNINYWCVSKTALNLGKKTNQDVKLQLAIKEITKRLGKTCGKNAQFQT